MHENRSYWNCQLCHTSWEGKKPHECGCGNTDFWPSDEPTGKVIMVMFEDFEGV